jgi:Endosomal/lysosomal potassium channel TMEM175
MVISPDPDADGARHDGPRASRLLPLSDGVIAIALTLLVLQLRVPSPGQLANADSAADLAAQLSKGSAQLVSYGIWSPGPGREPGGLTRPWYQW